jgi:hypothetical protein
VLAERLAQVADAGGRRLERKLSQIGSSLEHEQHALVAELQRRIGEAEVELRAHVQALASDAEAERTVMNARLDELRRRIDDLIGEGRIPPCSDVSGPIVPGNANFLRKGSSTTGRTTETR